MKELNVTEARLRSWRPRPPSAKLSRKLFSEPIAQPNTAWLWGGLAPTMACLMLTLMAINHGGDGMGARPMTALLLSNVSDAAYAADGAHTAQNHLAVVTFDSTNHSSLRSIIGFTPTTNFSY